MADSKTSVRFSKKVSRLKDGTLTRRGRVVYNRPTHRFYLRDAGRIIEALANVEVKPNEIVYVRAMLRYLFNLWKQVPVFTQQGTVSEVDRLEAEWRRRSKNLANDVVRRILSYFNVEVKEDSQISSIITTLTDAIFDGTYDLLKQIFGG